MSIQTKVENYLNYITGRAGGWPTNTNVAIIGNIDFITESGSNDVYINEINTNVGLYGTYTEQVDSVNLVSDYANQKGCTTAYVYGHITGKKTNPSTLQQPIISASFARHGIPVNFEYNDNTSHTYFSQRGQNQYTGSFHLFMQTPWYSDDTLLNIVSGSFNKTTFRNTLGSSPESSSLIPLFDTGSFSSNNSYHPDFVVKNPAADTSLQDRDLEFYKYVGANPSYQNAINSGSLLAEKYIVPSGSILNNEGYNLASKQFFWMTPDKNIMFDSNYGNVFGIEAAYKWVLPSGKDLWDFKAVIDYTTASGSLVKMFDDSTKQIQDIEVGDIVKSYKPVGMPDEMFADDWLNYSTTDLTGSTPSGSVVMRKLSKENFGYYLVNGSIKLPINEQSKSKIKQYFVKQGSTWSWQSPKDIETGDYFLDTDGNELEITSISEVGQDETFYSLDVEEIDTYFTSDILVHNIPPCFVEGTDIELVDGYKPIEDMEVGDIVLSYNTKTTSFEQKKVTELFVHDEDKTLIINDTLECTLNHPFFRDDEWVHAEELKVGDKILKVDGEYHEITKIETSEETKTVYNFEVEDTHCYFAEGYLAHNKCFTGDTMITLADGTYHKIKHIELGAKIKTYNEEKGKLQNSVVLEVVKVLHDNVVKYKFDDNTEIKATDDHPFYVNGELKAPLEVGDIVQNDDLNTIKVISVDKIDGLVETYNINKTSNGNNYFANRVLVSDESETE